MDILPLAYWDLARVLNSQSGTAHHVDVVTFTNPSVEGVAVTVQQTSPGMQVGLLLLP